MPRTIETRVRVAVARGLMTRLGIGERRLIDRAYIDPLGDGR
jgi:hypothetical protein